MKVKIYQAKKSHLKHIQRLVALYPKKLLQAPLPHIKYFFVAEYNKQIVGCIALEIYSKRLAEIRSLVVLPEFQKMGLGTRLVKICLKEARLKNIYEVLTITGSASLFGRFGFRTFNQEKYAMFKVVGE